MQESRDFFLDTYEAIREEDIKKLIFPLKSGDRIFLIGDLGSGKSTLVRSLLREHFYDEDLVVRSPTYTYYQKYENKNYKGGIINDKWKKEFPEFPEFTINNLPLIIYHFDLYRVESYDDLFLIGALEILEDPTSICLIEWPEILSTHILSTRRISITENRDGGRDYAIESYR